MIIAPRNIGNNVTTGAGSIVTKDINDNLKVVGNPAKILIILKPMNEIEEPGPTRTKKLNKAWLQL